jgi:hypothetical protein
MPTRSVKLNRIKAGLFDFNRRLNTEHICDPAYPQGPWSPGIPNLWFWLLHVFSPSLKDWTYYMPWICFYYLPINVGPVLIHKFRESDLIFWITTLSFSDSLSVLSETDDAPDQYSLKLMTSQCISATLFVKIVNYVTMKTVCSKNNLTVYSCFWSSEIIYLPWKLRFWHYLIQNGGI